MSVSKNSSNQQSPKKRPGRPLGSKKKTPPVIAETTEIPVPLESLQSQNERELDSEAQSDNENVVSVDIESNSSAGEMSFAERMKQAAANYLLEDDSPKENRGRKKKGAAPEEFNTLVVSLVTLVLSFSNIPEFLKPNTNELDVFSTHLTGLLLRHLPISGKMSADALDIIGLIAISSTYYARISPIVKELRDRGYTEINTPVENSSTIRKTSEQKITKEDKDGGDVLRKLNSRAADFLDDVERRAKKRNDTEG